MSLLAPAFLAGLAAVAIPVLVHLAYRTRGRPTPFPSLHFLRRIPFRTRRRRVLRHPLLFALRSAALVLLVLAFARPVLPGGGEGARIGDAREVVLLLDRSYSMAYADRWTRALAGLREAVGRLGAGDRISLVTFSNRAETLVTRAEDPGEVVAALDGLAVGHRTTRYETGFRVASRILESSDRDRRRVVLATDFQAVGWKGRTPLSLPGGTEVVAVDVSDAEPANLSLSELVLAPSERGMAELAVRVSNSGSRPVPGVELRLEVNGRAVGARGVDLEPRSASTVRFGGVALPGTGARGTFRLQAPAGANRLATDDLLHFFAAPAEALRARIVEAGRGRADRSLYLRRALSIGGEPPFETERLPTPGAPQVGETALVVLNDAEVNDGGSAGALAAFVEAGGGLLVALGNRSEPARWPEAARRLLPGRVGEPVDRIEGGGARLATVEYEHPVFQPFRAPRSGDLSAARFLRYRRIEPDTTARVLARFDDGAPALVEAVVGQGRVLVWSSTLDRSWNDVPVQPVYLPLVRRLAVHGAGWEATPRFWTVGEPLDVRALLERRVGIPGATGVVPESTGPGVIHGEWIVAAPGGGRTAVRTGDGAAVVVLDQPGLWQLRRLDGEGPLIDFAVNVDPAEADLTPLDREELLAAAGAGSAPGAGSAATGVVKPAEGGKVAASEAPADAELPGHGQAPPGHGEAPPGREIWLPLLAGATLCFLAEAVVARRLDGRRPLLAAAKRARNGRER